MLKRLELVSLNSTLQGSGVMARKKERIGQSHVHTQTLGMGVFVDAGVKGREEWRT